ncbi:MAG: phosphatidate cytidylyltransferase [Muribaculaceae bacterium]|nr:phosphatidate cytidylyltransferase [Muribaculaceae bacterium]
MDFKKLLIRALSGSVYCALIVVCALIGSDAVTCLGILFTVLAVLELHKILSGSLTNRIPALLLDLAGAICLCCGSYLLPILFWIIIMVCRFVEELYLKDEHPIQRLGESMLSQLYIGMPLGCMVAIAYLFPRPEAILAVFFFLWINDTGAFLTGSLFGKHRLFERISPKKSWEGFFGGYIFNLIAATLFATFCPGFFGLGNNIIFWLGLATIVTVFGTWGDLVESLIKRSMHIKDSGNLIPGHGGILDRIDSLLLAAPAVLIYLMIIEIIF